MTLWYNPSELTCQTSRQSPKGKSSSIEVSADDTFCPAVKPLQQEPKTPRRVRKTQPIRCRGSTEPPRLLSAFKSGSSYEPPKPRSRPFFPYQTSDIRRAGSAEPSSSTVFPDRDRGSHASIATQHGETPSRPLYLLANAASDAAEDNEHPHVTPASWLQSGVLTERGSGGPSNSLSSFPATEPNLSISCPHCGIELMM